MSPKPSKKLGPAADPKAKPLTKPKPVPLPKLLTTPLASAQKPPTKPKARTTPAAGVSAVSAVQNPVLSTAAPTEPAQITPPRATGSASSRSLPTWVLPSVRSTVHVVPPTPAPTKKRQAEQRAPGPGLQSPPSKKQQTEPRVSDLLQQADKDLQQIQLCTSQIARLRKDIGVLHSAAEVTARDSDEIIRGLSREIYDLRGALQFAHLQEARSQGASQALKLQVHEAYQRISRRDATIANLHSALIQD